jgi:tRNA(Ile)-lysidine synthase TilS/MesJ
MTKKLKIISHMLKLQQKTQNNKLLTKVLQTRSYIALNIYLIFYRIYDNHAFAPDINKGNICFSCSNARYTG